MVLKVFFFRLFLLLVGVSNYKQKKNLVLPFELVKVNCGDFFFEFLFFWSIITFDLFTFRSIFWGENIYIKKKIEEIKDKFVHFYEIDFFWSSLLFNCSTFSTTDFFFNSQDLLCAAFESNEPFSEEVQLVPWEGNFSHDLAVGHGRLLG